MSGHVVGFYCFSHFHLISYTYTPCLLIVSVFLSDFLLLSRYVLGMSVFPYDATCISYLSFRTSVVFIHTTATLILCVCVCVLFTVSLTHLYLLSLETSLKIRFIHSACVLYSMLVITVAHHNQLGCFCVVRLEIQFLRLKIQL